MILDQINLVQINLFEIIGIWNSPQLKERFSSQIYPENIQLSFLPENSITCLHLMLHKYSGSPVKKATTSPLN